MCAWVLAGWVTPIAHGEDPPLSIKCLCKKNLNENYTCKVSSFDAWPCAYQAETFQVKEDHVG